jgi:hypothetical protein
VQDPHDDEKFWKERWEQNPEFEMDYVNDRFPIKKFFNGESHDILINDFTNKQQMVKLISKRNNCLPQDLANHIPILEPRKNGQQNYL